MATFPVCGACMKNTSRPDRHAAALLGVLAREGRATPMELGSRLQLSRSSIFCLLERLRRTGLILQTDGEISSKGRPPACWMLNPEAGVFLVARLGMRCQEFRLYDFAGGILDLVRLPSAQTLESAVEALRQWTRGFSNRGLCGTLVAVAGAVDSLKGEVLLSKQWRIKDYPLRRHLLREREFPPLVLVENNSHMAALGEKSAGCCRTKRNFLTLSVHGAAQRDSSLGLGSGIVLNGRVYRGHRGVAGELDTLFYNWLDRHRKRGKVWSTLQEMKISVLKSFANDLGSGFAHVVSYLAPEKVVVQFFECPPSADFVVHFQETLHSRLLIARPEDLPVETSVLGGDSVFYGGLHLLREHYFTPSAELLHHLKKHLS